LCCKLTGWHSDIFKYDAHDLSHAEDAENVEFFREDVRDDRRYSRERRDATAILLDMINKMNMMPTDRRDVHTDILDRINMMDMILSDADTRRFCG